MNTLNSVTVNSPESQVMNFKKAVPVILLLFLFSLVVDNSFKIVSADMATALGLSPSTVSWQVTLSALVIGIGAVVYATLSDSISVRNLLSIGILLICAGSLIGYLCRESFFLIVIARVIQSAGLAATETLYVISVTKYMPKNEQKKFFGFGTSCFAVAQIIGTLVGGYVSTYVDWTVLFLVPLLSLIILPFILKFLPKEQRKKGNIDIIGLFLLATITASLILYMSDFNWLYLIMFAIVTVLFLLFISKSPKAFIEISFFKNKKFLSVLAIVFLLYSLQMAYIFMFPFLIESIYGFKLDTISLLFLPAYALSAIVGAMSGKTAKVLGSKQCIFIAISSIVASLLLGGFMVETSVWVFVFSMMMFSGAYGLIYAPLMETYLSTLSGDKAGTAIGFYNLCINISSSIGVAYVAALMESRSLQLHILSYIDSTNASQYSNVFFVLAVIGSIGLLLYKVLVANQKKQDKLAIENK